MANEIKAAKVRRLRKNISGLYRMLIRHTIIST